MRYGFGYFEEDHLGQVADLGLWRRIVAYSRPHWGKVAGAIVLSMIVIGASLALPYMVRLGIDRFVVNTSLESSGRISGLGRLAALFIGVILAGFAANFYQVFILEWTGQTIMHQMRQQLFGHMLGLDLAFFNNNPSGKLVTRLTNDIQNMHEMFTSVIVTLFNDFFQLAGILGILFWMNWRLALILSLLLPLIVVSISLVQPPGPGRLPRHPHPARPDQCLSAGIPVRHLASSSSFCGKTTPTKNLSS